MLFPYSTVTQFPITKKAPELNQMLYIVNIFFLPLLLMTADYENAKIPFNIFLL